MSRLTSLLVLLFASVVSAQAPPIAKKVPHVESLHGDRLIDEYRWLRHKGARDVEAYLRAEAHYAEEMMKPTAGLQERLYQEMLARIQEDDADPAWQLGAWKYYTRTEK